MKIVGPESVEKWWEIDAFNSGPESEENGEKIHAFNSGPESEEKWCENSCFQQWSRKC